MKREVVCRAACLVAFASLSAMCRHAILEAVFDEAVALRVRAAFCALWCSPSLPSMPSAMVPGQASWRRRSSWCQIQNISGVPLDLSVIAPRWRKLL